MSPKKSFLERMGLIEPAKPTIEVGKKPHTDGEKRVLGDVKLKRQPAEPMARSTEGQPVSQNVVELEKLRKEMEMAVTDYNQKSAEIHEGRDTSFDNDLSKMRKSVVDEVYDDGVLDPTPQFHFDDVEDDDNVQKKETKEDGKPSFQFNEASLEEQMDRLLGIQKEHTSKVENGVPEQKLGETEEAKPEEVLEETVLEATASPFNEFAAKSQVPTEPQFSASQPEEKRDQTLDSEETEPFEQIASFADSELEEQQIVETTDNSIDKSSKEIEEQQLLLMNQALLQNQKSEVSSERLKEEIEEQIQEKIHEQIEEKFERYKEEKNGIKEELKKELELEWKRALKEELRQELKKDIKDEVIQDVAQDVNQFKDEITSKVASKQEQLNMNADHADNSDMKSDWDEELSGKTAKRDMHAQYMDDQFVEETVEDAVVEVVESNREEEDKYVEDLMKEYQPGFTSEEESSHNVYVEDVQERGRSGKTMEKNRVSEEVTNRQKNEETGAQANTIQVKQEFTSTAASAFKPDLHIGEKLDLIIGQYEKNKLQSIDDIYKNSRMETDTKKTIFMADVFLKAIPANLPQDVKRETVLNILKISGIDLDSLLGDAYQRIDSLNKVLEETISTSNEIFKRNEDTIHELERRIQDLNEINVNRAKFQEDQNTMVEYEIQKIINLVEFVKPKSRS